MWFNLLLTGFPTIKIFGANKRTPIDYNSQRTAQAMADAALAEAKKKVAEKLGGQGGSSGGSGSGDVVELTDSNFDKLVLNSDDVWLVEVPDFSMNSMNWVKVFCLNFETIFSVHSSMRHGADTVKI